MADLEVRIAALEVIENDMGGTISVQKARKHLEDRLEKENKGVDSLSSDELEQARDFKEDIEELGPAAPESLKEDVADLLGEDSYEDAAEQL